MAANFKVLGYGHTGMTVRSSKIHPDVLSPQCPFVNLVAKYRAHTVSNSLRFWRDVLGVPVIWEQLSPPEATHTITGAPTGTTMKVVWLGLPQTPQMGGSDQPNHISTLELIEYELPANLPEEQNARTPQARPWDIGAVHICLVVQGLDEILDRVKAEGFHLFSDIFTVPEESPVPEARGQRICYLKGPDGELVELTDIPKQA